MKKNNKFRNNNYNNQIFSLNYRFDSISPAGKCSGTALDLIKRYNELAKEAQGNGNLVEAEVFRQYAEHYRKIVTEVNERKNQQQPRPVKVAEEESQCAQEQSAEVDNAASDNNADTTSVPAKREFKVIEITSVEPTKEEAPKEEAAKPARGRGRRKTETAAVL